MQHSRIRKPLSAPIQDRFDRVRGLSGGSRSAPGAGSCGGSTNSIGGPGAAMSGWDIR